MEGRSAERQRRERAAAALASRQLQLITVGELLNLGFSRSAIDSRARRGSLHRSHVGVYSTHPPPFTREQRWLAAVLACGHGTLLSDWPAAAHWRAVPSSIRPDLTPHVTVDGGRGRSRPGITVHQRGSIDPRDVRRKDGIPITSVDLMLIHLAPQLDEPTLEQMMVAANSIRLLKRGRLRELVEERRGRPGIHKLVSLLALAPAIAESDLELLFLPVLRMAQVERPLFNHPIRVAGRDKPLKVDLAWPDLRLVVELDSQRFHGDWERAEIDRDRDQLLALESQLCHRFVRRRVEEEPRETASRLRRLVELRRAAVGAAAA